MEFLLLILAFIIYWIPSFVANKKPHANGVFLVNLFFGWTMIGWIIALIWATTGEVKKKMNHIQCPKCNGIFDVRKEQTLFVCPNCRLERPMESAK